MPRTTGEQRTSKPGRGLSRSRTFTGCGTCRIRHIKCDEKTPTCSACERLKLPCQGYTPRLLWLTSSPLDEGIDDKANEVNYFRYPLFSESQRHSMTLDMVQSLGDQSASDVLHDLDNESVSDDHVHSVGPFGVFNPSPNKSSHEQPNPDAQMDHEDDQNDENFPESGVLVSELDVLLPSASSDALADALLGPLSDSQSAFQDSYLDTNYFDTALAGTDDWMSAPMNAVQLWDGSSPTIRSDLFNMEIRMQDLASIEAGHGQAMSATEAMQNSTQQFDEQIDSIQPSMCSAGDYNCRQKSPILGEITPLHSSFAAGISTLPPHTADLLSYIRTEVLETSSPSLSRGTSPWKMLLMPFALETVAELSLWNTASYARRSILSTLLAKSAFHLSQSKTQDELGHAYWFKIGADHQRDAQKHLRLALTHELEGNVKYVEVLMATLGAGIISVNFQGPSGFKSQLLVAERLIRSHGIPAKKTFQHRVLHHLYTHLRLFLESMNISPESKPSAQLIQAGIPRSFNIKPDDLGDLDSTRQKPESVGYNDIHLDVSGTWNFTLYPEMFGVPEALMTLLSQTISLAKAKPQLEASAITDPAISVALNKHIKTLEQQIWSWKLPSGPQIGPLMVHHGRDHVNQPLMENMILALHQALIIFFYRRVYNVSVMIVQPHVEKSLGLLKPCLSMAGHDSDFAISIGWSAFIAACEAATPELQELGIECLELVDNCGMFIEHGKPSTTAKAVWKRREELNDLAFGWPDMMKLSLSSME